jgi:hypothetical protein
MISSGEEELRKLLVPTPPPDLDTIVESPTAFQAPVVPEGNFDAVLPPLDETKRQQSLDAWIKETLTEANEEDNLLYSYYDLESSIGPEGAIYTNIDDNTGDASSHRGHGRDALQDISIPPTNEAETSYRYWPRDNSPALASSGTPILHMPPPRQDLESSAYAGKEDNVYDDTERTAFVCDQCQRVFDQVHKLK